MLSNEFLIWLVESVFQSFLFGSFSKSSLFIEMIFQFLNFLSLFLTSPFSSLNILAMNFLNYFSNISPFVVSINSVVEVLWAVWGGLFPCFSILLLCLPICWDDYHLYLFARENLVSFWTDGIFRYWYTHSTWILCCSQHQHHFERRY